MFSAILGGVVGAAFVLVVQKVAPRLRKPRGAAYSVSDVLETLRKNGLVN